MSSLLLAVSVPSLVQELTEVTVMSFRCRIHVDENHNIIVVVNLALGFLVYPNLDSLIFLASNDYK